MKKGLSIFVVLMLIGLFCFSAIAATKANKIYGNVNCFYVKNYDGDTLTVNISGYPDIIGKEVSVRINGIDTPEMRGTRGRLKEMALAAKNLVANICKKARIIELRNIKRGKYFRLIADVYCDGLSLAQILIDKGLAKPYDGGKKPNWE